MTVTIAHSRTNFYFVMLLVNTMGIGLGNTFSWTSPTIPLLMSPESPLPVDLTGSTFLASLFTGGAAISPIFASTVVQRIGFKLSFILFTVLNLVSWISLASLWNVYALYFGRLLHGLVAGMMYLTFPLYVSEVSEDNLRSAMSALQLFSRCFGILMEFAIGPYVSYHVLIIINAVTPILYLTCSLWMPESPYYLITKGKKDEAVKTVAWLRGGIPISTATDIANNIEMFIEKNRSQKKSFKDLVATRGNVRALFITMTLLALQQLTGISAMLVYTEQLFEMTGPGFSASISAIIYGAVYFIGSGFGPIFAKKFGFRRPLILSGILSFLAEFLLGVYLYCYEHGVNVSAYTYFPIVCALVYAGIYNCAVGSLPWAIMGEIFPPNIKGHASALATSSCFVAAFITTQLFPILSQVIGSYTVFWMFSVSSISVSIFTAVFVFDTKGLSLDQIQDKLNKRSYPEEKSKTIDERNDGKEIV